MQVPDFEIEDAALKYLLFESTAGGLLLNDLADDICDRYGIYDDRMDAHSDIWWEINYRAKNMLFSKS
jgi:hypothetical protein